MIIPNSFEKVLNHSILVSKETRGIPCTRAEQEASVFLHKNVLSGYTLFNILYPTPNASLTALSKGALVFDFPTAYVIIRAMFEAYINMYFLLLDPISDEELEFRLDRWDKHALTERQRMGRVLRLKNPRLAEEAIQIKDLESRILNSQYFAKLPRNVQQSIRNSHKWTSTNVLERADKACIHRSQSEFLYKYLSNYSHSEPYALMQLHDVNSIDDARFFCDYAARFGEMFLSLTLNGFARLNAKAREMVPHFSKVAIIIKFWEEYKRQDMNAIPRDTLL